MSTPRKPSAEAADDDAEAVVIGAEQFAPDARTQIQLAGLLADQPELRDAQLTSEDWQGKLNAYLASPRP